MYGLTPSIIMESFERPPPEKILSKPKKSLPDINCWSRSVSMPGMGMTAIKRNKTRTKRVNKILFLKILSPNTSLIL
jgi:hypothetical protein